MGRFLAVAMGLLIAGGSSACKKDEGSAEAPGGADTQPKVIGAAQPGGAAPQQESRAAQDSRAPGQLAARTADSDVEMTAVGLADLEWSEGPPALPKGVMISVLEGEPPFTGPRTYTMMARLPRNYTVPPHVHTATERLTVMTGALRIGHGDKLDRKSAKQIKAGGVVLIPANHTHFVFTEGEETILMLHGVGPWSIHYVDPKDDPRQPPPPRHTASPSGFDAPLADMVELNAEEITYADMKPGVLPPGAQIAVLEGTPPFDQPQTFTARLKLPKGYKIPVHWHPATERPTVISGTVALGMGDSFDEQAMTDLEPGSIALMPRGHKHYILARTDAVIQLNAVGPWKLIWANPEDDPARAPGG
jgi:quercetin dioxygenase-like cupin family protein